MLLVYLGYAFIPTLYVSASLNYDLMFEMLTSSETI